MWQDPEGNDAPWHPLEDLILALEAGEEVEASDPKLKFQAKLVFGLSPAPPGPSSIPRVPIYIV